MVCTSTSSLYTGSKKELVKEYKFRGRRKSILLFANGQCASEFGQKYFDLSVWGAVFCAELFLG